MSMHAFRGKCWVCGHDHGDEAMPDFAASPQPTQAEPGAVTSNVAQPHPKCHKCFGNSNTHRSDCPLYDPEQPEQPEPGVLTDERIAEISTFATGWVSPPPAFFSFARAIEREVLSTRKLSDEQVERIMEAVDVFADRYYRHRQYASRETTYDRVAARAEVERLLRG